MREIKFRGKQLDNGEWVYGVPIETKIEMYIITEKNPHVCNQYGYMEIDEFFPVDPETVGQYTGLKDKNSKEIYEGDKIKTYRFICKNGKQAIEYYNKIISSEDFHHDCYILGNIIDSGRTVEIIYESK